MKAGCSRLAPIELNYRSRVLQVPTLAQVFGHKTNRRGDLTPEGIATRDPEQEGIGANRARTGGKSAEETTKRSLSRTTRHTRRTQETRDVGPNQASRPHESAKRRDPPPRELTWLRAGIGTNREHTLAEPPHTGDTRANRHIPRIQQGRRVDPVQKNSSPTERTPSRSED